MSLALSGCGAERGENPHVMPLLPQAMPMDPPGGSGMLSLNTYAGDALVKQLLVRMGSGAGILTTNFVELDDFGRTSAFGRLASQQVGSRMGQHGFRVIEARVASMFSMNRQGEFMLTRDTAQLLTTEYDAGAVLVGMYKVVGNRMFVSARIVRIADNVLMGAYEYYLPLNEEVRALLGPSSLSAGGTSHEYDVWSRYSARGQAQGGRVPASGNAPASGSVSGPASSPAAGPVTSPAPVSYAAPRAAAAPLPVTYEKDMPLNADGTVGPDHGSQVTGRVIDPNSAPTPFPGGGR